MVRHCPAAMCAGIHPTRKQQPMFQKALPGRAPFKASFYGEQKTGKTTTAMLFAEALAARRGGRIAMIDTENGHTKLASAVPQRDFHPQAFDFDVVSTRSLDDTLKAVIGIDPKIHPCVVIDSMTHLWQAAFEAWEARNPGKDPQLKDWGDLKRTYKKIMHWLVTTPCDVMICGREKNIFETGSDGKLQHTGVGMKAEGETQYEPDIVFHMIRLYATGKQGEVEGTPALFCEGDRWGVLSGRTIPKPGAKTVEVYFPFIGDEAPQLEDPDARAERDGEAMEGATDKAAAKIAKSSGLLSEFQAKIAAVSTVIDLGKLADEIKKQKRYMTDDHLGAIRVYFESRRDQLVASSAGAV